MLIQLHENRRKQITLNGDTLEPFPITNGVKQGCVLAPTLFSMMLMQVADDLVVKMGCMLSTIWMAVSSIYGVYKPTPIHRRCCSWTISLWTTLPWSPTQFKLCSASHLAFQTRHGCLALTSVSGKLRIFCLSTENTDRHTSPLAMLN